MLAKLPYTISYQVKCRWWINGGSNKKEVENLKVKNNKEQPLLFLKTTLIVGVVIFE